MAVKQMGFADAIEAALRQAMAADPRIVIFGEDVHMLRRNLYVQFGPQRVKPTPISESAFLGAAVGAAMAGLRPVVEIMMIDFLGVAFDALLNQASKVESFSGGKWQVPMVVRAACGGGYGDAGQHEQNLWGMLAGIPGVAVAVPSNPADAAGLMLSALEWPGPAVYLEHKLLADYWLEYLGRGNRTTVEFDVPDEGASGEVPYPLEPVPFGKAYLVCEGRDLTIATLGVSVHRAVEAAGLLKVQGVSAGVLDLRTVSPLDREAVSREVAASGALLVVDEDYRDFGLSGELAACMLEAGLTPRYSRVATDGVIPFARHLEDAALPNVDRIQEAALKLLA